MFSILMAFSQDIPAWWIKIARLKNFGSPGWNRDERLSRTGTQSQETVGIGTKICGTSGTGTKSRGTVPHGCPAGQAGPGRKTAGLSCSIPSLALPIIYIDNLDQTDLWNKTCNMILLGLSLSPWRYLVGSSLRAYPGVIIGHVYTCDYHFTQIWHFPGSIATKLSQFCLSWPFWNFRGRFALTSGLIPLETISSTEFCPLIFSK